MSEFWQTILGVVGTVAVAAVAGYFGLRQAARTAQPNAQQAINAGFTALTDRQMQEIDRTAQLATRLEQTVGEQSTRIEALEGRIDEMQTRENRFQRALKVLVEHVHALRMIISDAGMSVPEDPVDPEELADLLNGPRRWPGPRILPPQ